MMSYAIRVINIIIHFITNDFIEGHIRNDAYGRVIFDIRGQHDVLKVKFKVVRVSKTALGAERRVFMTHRAYINNF